MLGCESVQVLGPRYKPLQRGTIRTITLCVGRIGEVVKVLTIKVQEDYLNPYSRIARGEIQSLDKLDVEGFSAVVFPGGFGAAKNLSNFAFEGPNLTVNEEVEKVLKGFHTAGRFE